MQDSDCREARQDARVCKMRIAARLGKMRIALQRLGKMRIAARLGMRIAEARQECGLQRG